MRLSRSASTGRTAHSAAKADVAAALARRLRDNRGVNGENQHAVRGRAHDRLSPAWRSATTLVLKVLLAVVILVLLGSVGGAAAYASPVTLPVLFLVARFSHRTAEGLVWASLAAATALETAWLLALVALGGAAPWIWLLPTLAATAAGAVVFGAHAGSRSTN